MLPSGEAFLATEGVILTLANGVLCYFAGTPGLSGYHDGPATSALLGRQLTICPDGRGGLYIGDRSNRCLRRLSRTACGWVVETVAGDPAKPPSPEQLDRVRNEGALPPPKSYDVIDGEGKAACFSYLHANVIADDAGNARTRQGGAHRRLRRWCVSDRLAGFPQRRRLRHLRGPCLSRLQ